MDYQQQGQTAWDEVPDVTDVDGQKVLELAKTPFEKAVESERCGKKIIKLCLVVLTLVCLIGSVVILVQRDHLGKLKLYRN
jgi:hypothetical protein